MSTLRSKTVHGIKWNLLETAAIQSIQFVVLVVLARILSPEDFGIIGMVTVFIAISQTLVEGGFSYALIWKQDCSDLDYSTVFYFNVVVSLAIVIILNFASEGIALYFREPALQAIVSALSFGVILTGLSIIHKTILSKNIDFKTQARISIFSAVGSGAVGLFMASAGYGVWSLVGLTLTRSALSSLQLWALGIWYPRLLFSGVSFQQLFGFGGKLLLSALIETMARNLYFVVIGKTFSTAELGFYTRADQFKNLPSQNLSQVISKVSFPVLSKIQNDDERMKQSLKKLLGITMFVTLNLMLGMASVAEPMVIALIGEKWRPSITFLQLLCFVGVFYPLQSLNLGVLQVKGRSDLFLKLGIIRKVFLIPVVYVGVTNGIHWMIVAMIGQSLASYFINSYWTGRLIKYHIAEQLMDIVPSALIATVMSATVLLLGHITVLPHLSSLILQLITGVLISLLLAELFHNPHYILLKSIAMDFFGKS